MEYNSFCCLCSLKETWLLAESEKNAFSIRPSFTPPQVHRRFTLGVQHDIQQAAATAAMEVLAAEAGDITTVVVSASPAF